MSLRERKRDVCDEDRENYIYKEKRNLLSNKEIETRRNYISHIFILKHEIGVEV